MRNVPWIRAASVAALVGLGGVVPGRADPRVIVSAIADPEYTFKKYSGEKPKTETYVVMQGHFFEGATVDKSVERMSFRRMVEIFAPELGRRRYFPAKSPQDADLLIVVHWGTTEPHASLFELTARTSPTLDTTHVDAERQLRLDTASAGNDPVAGLMVEAANEGARLRETDALDQLTDQLAAQRTSANAAQLLGYTRELDQLRRGIGTTADEYSLRLDLRQERYFIILKAYDLHQPATPGRPRPSVWTLHLNMGSPGNNFGIAVASMSVAAANFVGRTTDHIATINPQPPEGKVEIGPLLILGEVK